MHGKRPSINGNQMFERHGGIFCDKYKNATMNKNQKPKSKTKNPDYKDMNKCSTFLCFVMYTHLNKQRFDMVL